MKNNKNERARRVDWLRVDASPFYPASHPLSVPLTNEEVNSYRRSLIAPSVIRSQVIAAALAKSSIEYKDYHGYRIGNDGSIIKPSGRRMFGSLNNQGYRQVSITIGGRRTYPTLHSLVALLFIGDRPPNHVINHIDGNKDNNHYSNLEYCTYQHNSDHARIIGLSSGVSTVRGSKHPKAKLSEPQVLEIKASLASGGVPTVIARQYGVSSDLIYRIRDGKAWGWMG